MVAGNYLRHRITMAVMALCLALAGCDRLGIGVTPIGDITKDPAAFEGKDVTLRGEIAESNKIPLLNVTVYAIKDATGQIWVTTTLDRPAVGETVTVRGKIENAAILGGRGFGVTVAERERR
jgi:hypothetical protein